MSCLSFWGCFPNRLVLQSTETLAAPSDSHLAAAGKMQAGFQEASIWQPFFFKTAGYWNVFFLLPPPSISILVLLSAIVWLQGDKWTQDRNFPPKVLSLLCISIY